MTAPSINTPRLTPVGLTGLLVTFGEVLTDQGNTANLAFRAALEEARLEGVVETSTTLMSTFLSYDPSAVTQTRLAEQVREVLAARDWGAASLPAGRKRWIVPTAFEGDHAPQLAEAAALAGVTPDQAIADFTARPLRVMSLGFAPGQPYLGSLPPHWDIPRLQGLTPQVPAGALVVAIRQMVLFANASPTGWRQVGQIAMDLFRAEDPAPFRLAPSDEIHFVPVSASAFADIVAANADGLGGARCERIDP